LSFCSNQNQPNGKSSSSSASHFPPAFHSSVDEE
jgi:hypothetical protein